MRLLSILLLILSLGLAIAIAEKPLTYQNFAVALNASFMPLCGNGRLDTIADYQGYFNMSQRAKLMVSRARLTDGTTGEIEVQFAMDEVCDDGNRLDGDGCSADCLNFDSLVSACDIAMPPEAAIVEDFAFMGSQAVIAAKDALYTLSVGVPTVTMLAPKSAVVTSMLWFGGELWVFAESAVYVVRGGLMERNFTVTTSHDGYLVENANRLYLLCKDTGHIWFWDVIAKTLVSSLSGNAPRAIGYVKVFDYLQVIMEDSVTATVSMTDGSIAFVSQGATSDYWTLAGRALVSNYAIMQSSLANVSVNFVPETLSGLALTLGYRQQVLTPSMYIEAMLGPRWLLNASEPETIATLFIGAYDFNSTPIDYDVLKGGSLASGPSYLDTVTAAVNHSRPDLWPAQFAALETQIKQKLKRVTRLIENPTTKSLWVLQNGVLKDISRRGVLVVRDGRCVPTCAGLCPTCHWSPRCGSCEPCPRFSEALEWQLQCQPCASATGLARRRMLLAAPENVIAFAVMGTQADAEAAFPQCTATQRSQGFVDVEVLATANPQAAMRSVNSKLQNFQVVSRPRLVLHYDSGASTTHAITTALVISLVVSLAYII